MRNWIFQGNPDTFDIDGYLASRPGKVLWLARQHAAEMQAGDRVYLWRNQGTQKAIAGVVAEAIITEAPTMRVADAASVSFWRKGDATVKEDRATLRLVKVAKAREVVRRDWLTQDPVLADLPNLRFHAATNFPISVEHARRLGALWSRTGRDWTRNECVAGLMAYAETYGQPVSQLPGSTVARIAGVIGRAVSGVYAKVMNFRSLDPRGASGGMSGVGEMDRSVWAEFYDADSAAILTEQLRREYDRLWGSRDAEQSASPETTAGAEMILEEAEQLQELSIEALLARYAAQGRGERRRPARRVLTTRIYDRNPLVIAIARLRAGHACEVRDCPHPRFETLDGVSYAEVHHVVPLADGGEDIIDNVVCICPAHHREVHLGARAAELTAQLKQLRASASATHMS